MVSDLRKKFVVVTTALMLVTFGTFLVVNYIYNSYWYKSDTADMLDLIADSGYFLYDDDQSVELTIKNMTEDASPIVGLIVDENGKIIASRVIGEPDKIAISDNIIIRFLQADEYTYQIDRYLFSRKDLEDGSVLLVVLDTSIDENLGKKILGTSTIIIIGVLALILITFYLSKFVTEPAEKALMRERRFITDAGHELKTPLGAISVNAQALKPDDPDNLYVRNILSESERMGRLIERLLTLSKLEEGAVSIKNRISLSDLVTEMALTYESVAFEKHLSYDYRVEDDVYINGNDDEIRQLLAILIDNALKNAGEKGCVEIDCSRNEHNAVIKVTNTGTGISSDDIPHVFDRFYTSDPARSGKSFGLGLAIAKAIVIGHGGKISVESEPDKKTEFSVMIQSI